MIYTVWKQTQICFQMLFHSLYHFLFEQLGAERCYLSFSSNKSHSMTKITYPLNAVIDYTVGQDSAVGSNRSEDRSIQKTRNSQSNLLLGKMQILPKLDVNKYSIWYVTSHTLLLCYYPTAMNNIHKCTNLPLDEHNQMFSYWYESFWK